jgi:simple sugar transport system permease protein
LLGKISIRTLALAAVIAIVGMAVVYQLFGMLFLEAILYQTLKLVPALLLACLGELIAEKSGVLNLGVEGLMLMGAFMAFAVTFLTGNPLIGVIAAMGFTVVLGLVFAFFAVSLRTNQVVIGLGLWLFGLGLSDTLNRAFFTSGATATIPIIGDMHIPVLSTLPLVGRFIFQQNPIVYVSIALIPVVDFFLNRTNLGVKIRAVGENPRAAETMGVDVYKIRYIAVLIGAAFAGAGGAYYTTTLLGTFILNVTFSRGFIALALIYFGKWKPYRVLLPLIIFSFVDSLQLGLQGAGIPVKYFFLNMLPYITIVALIPILGRGAVAPAALMEPYKKGG